MEPDNTPFTDWIRSGEIEKLLSSKQLPKDLIDNITKGIIHTILEK